LQNYKTRILFRSWYSLCLYWSRNVCITCSS